MFRMRRALPAAAAVLIAGAAYAADPVKLDKAELEKVLAGKSISYLNVNGAAANVHFEKDGRATYRTGNSRPSSGTWQAGDDGRYCIKITSGTAQDHCRRVWKTDTGYALGGAGGELIPVNGLD
ncbi:MAG TPA: hypothetical protein VHM00_15730 [Caldimonas sp.]|jgi:hypothetical protein|nr:hypothetical protein [Caldimonas sp.]HEX2542521.1 hypothetical protein [Caldimonas sp.]